MSVEKPSDKYKFTTVCKTETLASGESLLFHWRDMSELFRNCKAHFFLQ